MAFGEGRFAKELPKRKEPTIAKTSIALTELAENAVDVDLVRDMLQFAAQKLMETDDRNRRPVCRMASML